VRDHTGESGSAGSRVVDMNGVAITCGVGVADRLIGRDRDHRRP